MDAPESAVPLVAGAPLEAPLAWRDGEPVSRRRYLADVAVLAARLPGAGPVLSMTADRYRFALGLGAAALRRQFNLLPPNHTPDTLRRLLLLFPSAYALVEDGAPAIAFPAVPFSAPSLGEAHAQAALPPALAADAVVAQVLTSGSTGAPMPHEKRWGLLARSVTAEAERIGALIGRAGVAGCSIVGTVPAQHMYGFESTVLLAMLGGAAFACERPFFPAEIVASLQRLPRPRLLVTTPLHLKTLLEAGLALPAVDLTLSATDALSADLARRAEDALGGPLMEIYGCTEAGQVASRRTAALESWRTLRDLVLTGGAASTWVAGGHVAQPTLLADVIEVLEPTRFDLRGRSNDLINIAGKRGSLSHLNHQLRSIAGVRDGAFWLPPPAPERPGSRAVPRLVAFVVLDERSPPSSDRLRTELRERIDAAFVPRRIVRVDTLPRDATGKLPASRLEEFARRLLPGGGDRVAPPVAPRS